MATVSHPREEMSINLFIEVLTLWKGPVNLPAASYVRECGEIYKFTKRVVDSVFDETSPPSPRGGEEDKDI